MSVHPTSPQFKANAKKALADTQLQRALGNVKKGFIEKRRAAADRLPEFEAMRDSARDIKDSHTLRASGYLSVSATEADRFQGSVRSTSILPARIAEEWARKGHP